MREWPFVVRAGLLDFCGPKGEVLTERVCPHGVGHPDPDSLRYLIRETGETSWSAHGCDGCCRPEAAA